MSLAAATSKRLAPDELYSPEDKPVVCQVLHSLHVGGAEILAARLARRLQSDFRFVFACLDDLGTLGEELCQEGFVVEVISRRAGLDVGCVRRLARFVQRHGVAIVHAHQYTPFFYARAPGWVGRRPPVLFTEHGRFYPDLPSRKRMVFNRLFLRRSDRVVAVGDSVKRALVNNEGIPPERISVVYNGVRLDDFNGDSQLRSQVRAELGISPQAPVAIQIARLDYLKDHCTALRAAAHVRQSLPDFQLLLVGEGPERSKIEAEIDQLGLRGTVQLLGLRSDIRRLLSAADVFLLTSISEGIPVTLIEAMGARLAVVTTAAGGVGEVVESGRTGTVVPVADDQAIAQSLTALLGDAQRREQFGKLGRERAAELFSEPVMHANYSSLYRQMLHVQPRLSAAEAVH
jgi:L-malate glycosyltransferase